jgi:hypothetical protein
MESKTLDFLLQYWAENNRETNTTGLTPKKGSAEKGNEADKNIVPFYLKFFNQNNQSKVIGSKPDTNPREQKIGMLTREFLNYTSNIRIQVIDEDEKMDILGWWNSRRILYPNLFHIVIDLFSAQATSVQSERLFSKAGIFLGKDRTSILKENLRKSFCLSEWLRYDYKDY